ncbi:DNA-3-methyladenine glycosylase family protein [Paenibacillus apiarius]|uniref:DNA-3-methyladenine glycosylase II n=1 Tax=Paenibacillus apiarius TaxID=46240 RepID=A0ABT4DUK1_9BACL|nr:DNA-3-methyladenine glycosylase 2 [Paenibacillus apiarius]MCY9516015.1 DNA-3-methyladenine glycosylase 2 [Paenibacillus apiarius]MCY9520925.1 DNA-3-methyladenine glycosylase 2 [Paenibacillus apiarius]MCY9553630.1 DNA-3-methyladenine glycosylase 2 [Paenibacillus apiarius]MCY9557847.1 DNA-3-methyladenine glycosylase 2 [Paenibacillus apiarius]MCY9685702.1 DNA-3-methyladenine glycosylase 2 [Paenibacillus apiarius]
MNIFETDITPVRPYNFGLALAYLRSSTAAILERVNQERYSRVLTFAGSDVLVQLTSTGPIEHTTLHLQLIGEQISKEIADKAVSWVRRTFTLETEPSSFHGLYAHDPILGRLMQNYRGLRPVLVADPYEALIWAIIGQQVHVRFARKLKLAFVELCGRQIAHDEAEYGVFPQPGDVAMLKEGALRDIQMSHQKARTIITVSQAVASGELNLPELRNVDYSLACNTLMKYKGVGRWTAESVLMRGLGFPDAIPAADAGLQSIIGRTYGIGKKATEEQVRQLAERWAPWRGWAAFLWWFQLQTEELAEQHSK